MNISSILLSQSAVIGNEGVLTIVGVFNELQSETFPMVIPQMSLSLVVHTTRDQVGTEHVAELVLLNRNREPIAPTPVKLPFQFTDKEPPEGLPLRHNLTANINGLPVQEPGPFAFEVYIDDIYSGGTAFYVGLKS